MRKIEGQMIFRSKDGGPSRPKGGNRSHAQAGDIITFYEDDHFTSRKVKEVFSWGVKVDPLYAADGKTILIKGKDVGFDQVYEIVRLVEIEVEDAPILEPLQETTTVTPQAAPVVVQAAPVPVYAPSRTDRDPRLPPAGTTLSKAHKGQEIRVLVQEDGFLWEGKTYKSLSKVAQEATGAKSVNGFAFFKLSEPWAHEPTLEEMFQ